VVTVAVENVAGAKGAKDTDLAVVLILIPQQNNLLQTPVLAKTLTGKHIFFYQIRPARRSFMATYVLLWKQFWLAN